MKKRIVRFPVVAALLLLLFSATTVAQTTYTVGGAGANYSSLNALRQANVMRDGDTIVLRGGQYEAPWEGSLTHSVTIKGSGVIYTGGNNQFLSNH